MIVGNQAPTGSQDPVIQEALYASLRTAVNITITLTDFFPGLGEVISWAADIGKIWKKTDLTPDVSKTIAWGTELLEFVSWGSIPSHAIETVLQLTHDIPRLKAGWHRWRGVV